MNYPSIKIISAAAAAAFIATSAWAVMRSPLAAAATSPAIAERDGRHDFDFLVGSWKVQHRRLRHPLSGSTQWYAFGGTSVMRSILDFANMDENVLNMPSRRVRGVTIRLYDMKTHDWSIYWGTNTSGTLALPATVGKFDGHGVGRFYDRETFDGKPIVTRYTWTHATSNTCHWEQAFSPDGGKTWETNWVSDFTRVHSL